MATWLKRILITIVGMIFFAALGFFVLDHLDWNRFRGPIAHLTKKYLGRELAIAGNLRGRLFTLKPFVQAERLKLENAAWGERQELATADQIFVQIRVLPLLRGRLDLDRLELDKPNVLLEKRADGLGNWVFADQGKKPSPRKVDGETQTSGAKFKRLVALRRIRVEGARLVYVDHATAHRTSISVTDLVSTERGPSSPTVLNGHGSVDSFPFSLFAKFGSLRELADAADVPFLLQANLAESTLRADGQLKELKDAPQIDTQFQITGRNLSNLARRFDLDLGSDLPLVKVGGHLEAAAAEIRLTQVEALIGGSQAKGEGSLNLQAARPTLAGKLVVSDFRWQDVKAFIPEKTSAKAAAPKSGTRKETDEKQSLFSTEVIDAEFLKSFDLNLELTVQRVEGSQPIQLLDQLSLNAKLINGRLEIKPLQARVAKGKVTLKALVDAHRMPLYFEADLGIKGLDLETLALPFVGDKTVKALKSKQAKIIEGRMGGMVKLHSSGASLHELASHLTGETGVAIENGSISAPVSGLLPLDLTNAIQGFLQRGKDVALECVVTRVKFADGQGQTAPLLIATKDANIVGQGQFNLASESFDLTIRSYPKDFGIGSLRTPIEIKGTFLHPKVDVKKGPLAAKLAAAVGLGALIGPAAALVPLIEPGLGNKGACGAYAQTIARIESEATKLSH